MKLRRPLIDWLMLAACLATIALFVVVCGRFLTMTMVYGKF